MFPFSCAFAYACVRAATSESEIPLRHNTSTRILPHLVKFGLVKTLDLDYYKHKNLCLCLCLRRISFLLGSSLLLSFVLALVLASLVKTRLKQNTTATTTRTSPNKRFNEQNNSRARAL